MLTRSCQIWVVVGCLVSCAAEESAGKPKQEILATRLLSWTLTSAQLSEAPRWPTFLFVDGNRGLVWGGDQGLLRIPLKPNAGLPEPFGEEFTSGLDALVAGARAWDGTFAVVDSSGRVAVKRLFAGKSASFETHFLNRPGSLAVTEAKVYLLLQGDLEQGPAVVAYTHSGKEVGRWGEMPASGILQARLKGGGIAACSDGSVFYSYINSPQIIRIARGETSRTTKLGRKSGSFKTLSARAIRRAQREAKQSRSVAPLVKLGLSTSRVQSLFCSQKGLLLRQVAQPKGGGAHIEVWDSRAESLIGAMPTGDAVLLDVRDDTLYLGALRDGHAFSLDRIQVAVVMSRLLGSVRP